MSAKTIGAFFILLIAVGGFSYLVPIMPVTVQEPYEVNVSYEEQEPYTVQVPYTIEVPKTMTQTVCNYYCPLGILTFETEDFTLMTGELVKISWSSTEDVNVFAVMSEEAWDSLYTKLLLAIGLPAVLTLLSGGTLAPITMTSMLVTLPSMLNLLSGDKYYTLNSDGESETKNLNAGDYKIFVLNVAGSGSLSVKISYNYQISETETRYRDETRYRTVTKYRLETRYRDVEKRVTLYEYITNDY